MHAEKCPVCESKGKIEKKKCYGCNGKGWVEVQDSTVPYIPYEPYEPYYLPYPQPGMPLYPSNPWCEPWYQPTITTGGVGTCDEIISNS